ncbi:hypothetical protein [Virgibacillus sp. MG-45]
MQKWFVLLCSSIILLLLISACGKKEDNAVEFGKEFIKGYYHVEDLSLDLNKMNTAQLLDKQNKFSTYFTEKEFEDLANKRFF